MYFAQFSIRWYLQIAMRRRHARKDSQRTRPRVEQHCEGLARRAYGDIGQERGARVADEHGHVVHPVSVLVALGVLDVHPPRAALDKRDFEGV